MAVRSGAFKMHLWTFSTPPDELHHVRTGVRARVCEGLKASVKMRLCETSGWVNEEEEERYKN